MTVIPITDRRERSGVIVGVGGSDEPLSAALFAAELARLRGEELHLVYACPDHRDGADTVPDEADEADEAVF